MNQTPNLVIQLVRAIVQRLRTILVNSDFVFTELYSGITIFLWGMWIANPHYISFSASSIYAAMNSLPIPEDTQGLFVASIGVLQIIGLVFNSIRLRKVGAFTTALLWMFISILFIGSNPASTATVIYPMLAVAAIWAYWRITIVNR